MGTHAAMGVWKNGIHTCCEKTLDGYNLVDAVEEWIVDGNLPTVCLPDRIGSSDHTEWGREREGQQEFYFGIDWDRKRMNIPTLAPRKEILEGLLKLLNEGWTFDEDLYCNGDECNSITNCLS